MPVEGAGAAACCKYHRRWRGAGHPHHVFLGSAPWSIAHLLQAVMTLGSCVRSVARILILLLVQLLVHLLGARYTCMSTVQSCPFPACIYCGVLLCPTLSYCVLPTVPSYRKGGAKNTRWKAGEHVEWAFFVATFNLASSDAP